MITKTFYNKIYVQTRLRTMNILLIIFLVSERITSNDCLRMLREYICVSPLDISTYL